jgi:hypothetical protein
MEKSHSPHELDPRELAHLCDQRAHELQTRAWRSEAERDALREATADLLSAVARELGASAALTSDPLETPGLSDDELRTLIATRVVHQPLHPTHRDDNQMP